MAWPEAYSVGNADVPAVGYEVDDHEAESLAPAIQAMLQDTKGAQEVRTSLEALIHTEFERERLEAVLAATGEVDEWRVGESLAEHHLENDHDCSFPWPSGRDLKNPGTSSGGVDLIGFKSLGDEVILALAEVKTSRQSLWPPSLLTARHHGLEAQLEGLRDGDDRKTWAVRYLAMHAVGRDWEDLFKRAMIRYLGDTTDVHLFGVLVHLTQPNELDLRTRARNLAVGRPIATGIHLSAIYTSDQGLTIMAGKQVKWETPQ